MSQPTDPDARSPEALAEVLLDAQVAFLLQTLDPEAFLTGLGADVDDLLAMAARLRLGEVVTREQITGVAVKYAAQMRMPGSIPEIASEIADRVYNHPAQDANRVDEVFTTRHMEQLITKLLELPLIRERLLASPPAQELAAEWVYRIVVDATVDAGALGRRVPGLGSMMGLGGRAVAGLAPDAAVELETRARAVVQRATTTLLARARGAASDAREPWLAETLVELWREQANRPMASLRELFSQEDLEEILILLYDLWLSVRETPYLQSLIGECVDFFFDKYATTTLLDLIREFGIGRDDLMEEAERFAPPIIALLVENGMAAAFLRRRLAPFYRSEAALRLLS